MIKRRWVWAVVCIILLAGPALPQCVSTLHPVSLPTAFPNHEAGPIVWNGSSYGVVKVDADPFTHALWFAAYNASLQQATQDASIAPASVPGQVEVVWNGAEPVVFYQSPGFQLLMQRIASDGTANGLPVAVATSHGAFPGQDFDVEWDPSRRQYLMLHSYRVGFDRGLWLAAIATDGTTLSDTIQSYNIADPPLPQISVTPTGTTAIVWQRTLSGPSEVVFGVTAPGSLPASPVTLVKNGSTPRIATDGRSFFVVYTVPSGSNTSDLHATKLDLTGKVTAPDAKIVAGSGIDIAASSVIPNPTFGEWAVLYVDMPLGENSGFPGVTRFRRIPFNTSFAGSDTTFVGDTTKINLAPLSPLIWNGASYVTSLGRTLSVVEGTESYIARHCPVVVTGSASPAIANPNTLVNFTAQAGGGSGGYTYSWSFGDVSSPAPGQSVSHIYPFTGTYTVTVTATDNAGESAVSTFTVQIANLKHRSAKK